MFKKLTTYLILLLLSFSAMAQLSKAENEEHFDNAMQQLLDEDYERAMMLFTPLTVEHEDNLYADYAKYFFSLSAFHLGKYTQATQNLMILTNNCDDWKIREDAYYLLSNIFFEQKDYARAFTYSDKCTSGKMIEDAIAMQKHYLSMVQELPLLEELHKVTPDNQILAKVLLYRLAGEAPLFGEEKMLFEYLKQEYEIESKNIDAHFGKKREEAIKDTYDIAVMFPFELRKLQASSNIKRQQFVLDLYRGMLEGNKMVNQYGKTFRLWAYDTKKDTSTVKNLLKLPEIGQMDLIVGPIYKNTSAIVIEYCKQMEIGMVNPLSNQDELLDSLGFVFLYKPSYKQIALENAKFSYNKFESKIGVIICRDNPGEIQLGEYYKAYYEEMGGTIQDFIKIRKGRNIIDTMTRIGKVAGAGHIFSPSSNKIAATNVTGFYVRNNLDIPLIGHTSWFDYNEFSVQNFKKKEVYFYNDNFINTKADSTTSLYENYLKNYKLTPSSHAYNGYELITRFCSFLHQHGKYFGQEKRPLAEGLYVPIIDYSDYYANNFVPIFKLQDYQLILQNSKLDDSNDKPKEE